MNKRTERITLLLQILLATAVTLALWMGWKGAALNQRYERSIQQYEQSTEEYSQYLDQSKQQLQGLIEQMKARQFKAGQ